MPRHLVYILLMAVMLGAAPTRPTAAARDQGMPPLECISMIREARIARMQGKQAAARTTLLAAAERFPDEMAPLVALLSFHAEVGLGDEDLDRVRSAVAALIRRVLPSATTLSFLSRAPHLETQELAAILAATQARLSASPGDTSLMESVAVLQQRLGEFSAARDSFRALGAADGAVESSWQAVELDYEIQDWEALVLDLALIRKRDSSPFIHLAYVEALGKAGRFKEFLKEIEIARAHPFLDINELLLSLFAQAAWDMRDLGKDTEAESLFRQMLELQPDEPMARQALLYLYTSPEERLAQVAKERQRLMENDSADPIELLNQGANLMAAGDAAGAYDLVRRAVDLLPEEEIAWFNLGLVCTSLEKWAEAEQALARAIQLNPSRAQSYFLRGHILSRAKRCPEAIPLLQQAMVLDPGLTQAHYFLYVCYEQAGDAEKAKEALAAFQAAGG